MKPAATSARPTVDAGTTTLGTRAVHPTPAGRRGGLEHLSPREREVLELVAVGLSVKQIAQRLKLSPLTIKGHKVRMVDKLGGCGTASNTVAIGWARGYLHDLPRAGGAPPELSLREYEVLACLPHGLTTPQIAAQLGLSPNTAKIHLSRLMEKLGVTSRVHAVLCGFQSGLLKAAPRERP